MNFIFYCWSLNPSLKFGLAPNSKNKCNCEGHNFKIFFRFSRVNFKINRKIVQ